VTQQHQLVPRECQSAQLIDDVIISRLILVIIILTMPITSLITAIMIIIIISMIRITGTVLWMVRRDANAGNTFPRARRQVPLDSPPLTGVVLSEQKEGNHEV
jgi:type IV secretory pathway component VirB8